MEKKPIYGTDPEKILRLLSIGEDEPDFEEASENSDDSPVINRIRDEKQSHSSPASGEDLIERLHTNIEGYRIIRVLGEGGMGIVYLAEQKYPIRRQVALKIIKPGMNSRRVLARFEAEQQTLACLDHPNIAKVFDAGTTEAGCPFFVMEYVEGVPITEFCDSKMMSIRDRLSLFSVVCQAIQHAHQNGIIHRDIKPSNILVGEQDGQPTPKVIDFGVAKAMGEPLTECTLKTENSQLLGTPEYMSPEQADIAHELIDTRSDVYSLGVLLYVLLVGSLPFEPDILRQGGIENIRKTIRETNPKTPSTQLTSLGEEAAKVAEMRSTEISTLAKHLKKELEWIPLKAMRKERSERYQSASQLADDIDNYLRGVPLVAGPPTTFYRVKKFVRRNAVLSAAVLAVAVTVIVGLVGITVMYFRVGEALAKERLSGFETQAISDLWTRRILGDEDFSQRSQLNLEDALDKQTELLKKGSKDQPTVEASIRHTLGDAYMSIGKPEKAEEHLERAYQLREQHLGPEHAATNKTANVLCWAYWQQGRLDDAYKLWSRQIEIIRLKDAGRYKQQRSGYVLLFTCNIGRVCSVLGRDGEAEVHLKNVLGLCERSQSTRRYYVSRMASQVLGRIYMAQGRYEEAEDILQKMWKDQRQQLGNTHPDTMEAIKTLIELYEAWDKPEQAEEWRAKLPQTEAAKE